MTYHLVIFYFDGTLADSFPWFQRVFDKLAERYRFKRIILPPCILPVCPIVTSAYTRGHRLLGDGEIVPPLRRGPRV